MGGFPDQCFDYEIGTEFTKAFMGSEKGHMDYLYRRMVSFTYAAHSSVRVRFKIDKFFIAA